MNNFHSPEVVGRGRIRVNNDKTVKLYIQPYNHRVYWFIEVINESKAVATACGDTNNIFI